MEEKTMTTLRAEACLEALQRMLPQCKNIGEAFARAAKEPAPRFYMEFPRAYRCVMELERHGKRVPNPQKAAMVDELHRRWKARGVKHYAVLEEILEEPAPSFYMTAESFRALVYRALRLKNKKLKHGKGEK